MDDRNFTRTQYMAAFLIVFGMGAIAFASHFNYRDMIIAAVGVVGAGSGLITGQSKNQAKDGGQINITNPQPTGDTQ